MDETHSYIQPRARLLRHLSKYGAHSLFEPDLSRSHDETVALVDLWLTTKAKESKLRPETLGCVSFTSKGKIDIHDPARLEELNAEISSLRTRREALEAAIERLAIEAPDFLCDLYAARDAAEDIIARAPREINYVLGTELRYFNASSPEAAMKSPRVEREKKKWDAAAARAKAKLEALEPKIAIIEDQLEACRVEATGL